MLTGMLSICAAADASNTVTVEPNIVEEGTNLSDTYLVLDNSLSMQDTDPDKLLAQCVEKYFTLAPAGDSTVGVITYSADVDNIKEPIKCTGKAKDLGDIGYDQKSKGTNIGNALAAASAHLSSEGSNMSKSIILVTDGDPDGKSNKYEPVKVNGKTIPVYCIYINDGENKDEDRSVKYLKKIAEDTGVNEIFEVKKANQIDDKLAGIIKSVYGINPKDPTKVPVGDAPVDAVCTIPEDIYEANAEIKFDAKKPVTLKITDPNGNVAYDKKTCYNPLYTVAEEKNSINVKLQWPEPGDYIFTLVSEEKQEIHFDFIEISAGLKLELSNKGSVPKGKPMDVSCALVGESTGKVISSKLRLYDDGGKCVMSSDTDDEDIVENQNGPSYITMNSTGGFTIDTSALDVTKYGVVAISGLDNGKQVASVMKQMEVTNPINLMKYLPFVIILIILIIAIFVLLKIKASRPHTCRPAKGQLNVKITAKNAGGNRELISIVDLPLPQSLPDGKMTNLYDLVYNHLSKRNGALDSIQLPVEELRSIRVSCWLPNASAKNDAQYFEVQAPRGENNVNVKLTRTSPNTACDFESGVRVEIKWK